MARYSESLIRALTSPTYGRGLFTAAQNVGQIPRQMRAQQQAERERQLLASIDPNTVEGMRQLAAFYQAKGDVANANKYATQARERLRTGIQTLETGQQEIETEVNRKRLARQASELARSRGQMALSRAAESMPEADLIKYLTGQTSGDPAAGGSNTFNFGSNAYGVDEQGNLYNVGTRNNMRTGLTESVLNPIGGSPQDPVGQIRLVPKDSGMTPQQLAAVSARGAGATADETAWSEQRADVVSKAMLARPVINDMSRLGSVLDEIEASGGDTGGISAEAKAWASQNLGIESLQDYETFKKLAGQNMLGLLRSSFGANPTEGERRILAEVQAGLESSTGVNRVLIQRAIAGAQKNIQLSNWLDSNPLDSEEFNGDIDAHRRAFNIASDNIYGIVRGTESTTPRRRIDL